ncbi:glutamate receptor 3-like [Palaemon carinicauda]|uniref:glutamate receptor 3-like n=1 Tax=Palaemon carinicauda TaxID=392227 RepID=UPI0035B616D4
MTSAVNDLHLPLDHKVVFATVHENDEAQPTTVDLWDVYKAAAHFVPKRIFLGSWSSKEWRPSHDISHQELSWEESRSHSEQERRDTTHPSPPGREQYSHLPFFSREPWQRRNDLMGFVLRCSTLQDYRYTMYDGVNQDGTLSFDSMRGMSAELFHILKQTMNFTPRCFENADQLWGSLRDGKWNGLVADLVEDRADIVVSDLDLNYARSQVIDYPYGWQTGGYHMLMRHVPAVGNVSNSYTKEFTWHVWLLIVMFGMMLGLSLVFTFRQSPYHEEMCLSEAIWLIVAAFCNAGIGVSIISVSSRILLLVLYLTIMMLYAYYNSFLISFLTVDTNILPFTTLEGMYEAGTHSFGCIGRTSIEDIIKFSPVPLHNRIWNEIVMADPENLSPSISHAITRLCSKNHVLMATENMLLTIDWPCKVLLLPGTHFVIQRSMPLQKDSSLLAAFRFQMTKIVEVGIVDRLEKKWKRKPDPPETESSAISLLQASPAFFLLLIGIFSSLIVLMIEIVWAKQQNR